MSDTLFGKNADEKSLLEEAGDGVVDNSTVIDHDKKTDRILADTAVVRGAAMFVQTDDLWHHGVSQHGLARSNTRYGETTQLVLVPEGSDGCETIIIHSLRGGTQEVTVKRRALPMQEEVVERVLAATDEALAPYMRKYSCRTREQLVGRWPAQGRGPIYIDSVATRLTHNDWVDDLGDVLSDELLRSMQRYMKAMRQDIPPSQDDVEIIHWAMGEAGLKPVELYQMLLMQQETRQRLLVLLGEDELKRDSALNSYDPSPAIPDGWGLPSSLEEPMKCKKAWNAFLKSGGEVALSLDHIVFDDGDGFDRVTIEGLAAIKMTRDGVNRLVKAHSGITLLETTANNGQFPPSHRELTAAVVAVHEKWADSFEAWQERRTPSVRWVALGNLTGGIGGGGGDLNGTDEFDVDADIRPKPGFQDIDPVELKNPEEAWLKKQVMGMSTPDPITQFFGDTGSFASDLPIGRRKIGEEVYLPGGHPLAQGIMDIMAAANGQRDYVSLGLTDDASSMVRMEWPKNLVETSTMMMPTMAGDKVEVEVLVFHPVYEGVDLFNLILSTDWVDHAGQVKDFFADYTVKVNGVKQWGLNQQVSPGQKVMEASYTDDEGQYWFKSVDLEIEPGARVAFDAGMPVGEVIETVRDGQTFCQALVRVWPAKVNVGYRHRLHEIDANGEAVPIDENDPLLAIYGIEQQGDVLWHVMFKSRLDFLITSLGCTKVPVLALVETGEEAIPMVVEQYAKVHFPALFNWLSLLSENYHEAVSDMTEWSEGDGEDLLRLVTEELMTIQTLALELIVEDNIGCVADYMDDVNVALGDACIGTSSKFPDRNGNETSAYGALLVGNTGRLYPLLDSLKPGPQNVFDLPEEAHTNITKMFKAMGYLYNDRRPLGADRLQQMVGEQFFFTHPLRRAPRRVNDRWHRAAKAVTYTKDPSLFSSGMVGNLVSQLSAAMFPINDGGLNLFHPSEEHMKAANWDYEKAMRLHLIEIFPEDLWGRTAASRAHRYLTRFNQDRGFFKEDAKALRWLICNIFNFEDRTLVHPTLSGGEAIKAFGRGVLVESFVKGWVNERNEDKKAQRLTALDRRVALLTPTPPLLFRFLALLEKNVELEAFNRALMQAAPKLGPLGVQHIRNRQNG
jgi:hypothetical protein